MRREKRRSSRASSRTSTTIEAAASVSEEIRLYGAPLASSSNLFVEDRTGNEQMWTTLGVSRDKRQLTIDRILKPTSRIHVPETRKRRKDVSSEAVLLKRLSRSTRASHKERKENKKTYDIWADAPEPSSSIAPKPKQTGDSDMAPGRSALLSYRPDMKKHGEALLELEVRLEEQEQPKRVIQSIPKVIKGETMVERANRELLDPKEASFDEDSENETETNNMLVKQQKRRPGAKVLLARAVARDAKKQRKLLQSIDRLPSIIREVERASAAAAAVNELVCPANDHTEEIGTIPLLPDEVPSSLLALPATHCNPVKEQYKRILRRNRRL